VIVRDEGHWWEYRSAWVKTIDERYERCLKRCGVQATLLGTSLSPFVRSTYTTKDPEREWIEEQTKNNPGFVRLHLVSNIRIDKSRSPVELADLYCPNAMLLSVKRGDELAKIDEVAGQVEAAARMLVREPAYLMKASELCDSLKASIDFDDRKKITFGCVTIMNDPKLSIRAKERIVAFFQKMDDFNFEPIWLFVDAKP
jgi:uncharacterized protein (TIGR04141 family)